MAGNYRLIEVSPILRRYAALDAGGARLLVTRLVPPAHLDGAPVSSATLIAAVNREATARMVAAHPAVPPIRSVHPAPDGGVDLAEPMPSGVTLRELVLRLGPLRVDLVASLVWHLAGALDALHDAGSSHLALSPRKILLAPGGDVRLLDVGIARLVREMIPGFRFPDARWEHAHPDPAWAAPELLGPEAPGPPADTFALAGVAFFALTGGPPFSGRTAMEVYAAIRQGRARPAGELRPGLSPSIVDALRAGLAPFLDDRPPTAAALAERLFGPRERIAPLPDAMSHDLPHLGHASYDAHLPTLTEPEAPAALAGIAAGTEEARSKRLAAAAQALDRMRAGEPRRGRDRRRIVLLIVVVFLAILALPFLLRPKRRLPILDPPAASDPAHGEAEEPSEAPE